MLKFPTIGCPLTSPAFRPRFFGGWAENQNSAPNMFSPRPPVSKKVRHDPPAPKPWEEIDLAETSSLGSGLYLEGLWVQNTCPKITCKELSGL